MSTISNGVPGPREHYPIYQQEVGTVLSADSSLPLLFQPLKIRNIQFKNRIFVSPMAQWSSDNGHATDWHLVHYGGLATRGVGAICIEATAVLPEGRGSAPDAGIWTDSHIEPLKRIVDFAHAHGTVIGVQLVHSGRKGSGYSPWVYKTAVRPQRPVNYTAGADDGGWPDDVWAPSAIQFSKGYPCPKEMDEERMKYVEEAFVAATKRCEAAGFDFVELHGAHGYLLHEFCSPLSNLREDEYGGTLENRLRYPLQIVERCREVWPSTKPLFYRLSATDWSEGHEKDEQGSWKQWGIEQSIILSGELKKRGVDLIDVSTGGLWSKQKIPVAPGYQVQFAEAIKKAHPDVIVGAVGLIDTPQYAEQVLESHQADVIFLGRPFLRNPHWAIQAAEDLGVAVKPANQYERGWPTIRAPMISVDHHDCLKR
ncbi:NADH:flavin oxidoreductase/NADH oxidase [Stereum hirsutum FP-91666 SS1]|uniref:NADH:flavin oxidoreductase/NADH oxidase n=1 Tax=Stereum hirsutum (strain FP-91666) TaxID=721885 RepID=UPI00044496C4|nr:NADH:flavin oxidoreductase/NADH oxidase [Stereum hirsutum FP-91666 SS1]EIM83802.1 NADH:flavin oxidoreductase/NADH oxidase [Stereum hirsutum FP-91666 SS1]